VLKIKCVKKKNVLNHQPAFCVNAGCIANSAFGIGNSINFDGFERKLVAANVAAT
jgi:hypothetical protein